MPRSLATLLQKHLANMQIEWENAGFSAPKEWISLAALCDNLYTALDKTNGVTPTNAMVTGFMQNAIEQAMVRCV